MKKTTKVMELTEDFSLAIDTNGVTLLEKQPAIKWILKDGKKIKGKDGKFLQKETTKVVERHYGTVYQALQGFLRESIKDAENLASIRKKVMRVMDLLEESQGEIKEMFRCEVEVAGRRV